jgi:hypothetical protein
VLRAERRALARGRAPQHAIRGVYRANPQQALQPGRVAADRSLEEVAATVREAAEKAHAVLAVLRSPVLEDVDVSTCAIAEVCSSARGNSVSGPGAAITVASSSVNRIPYIRWASPGLTMSDHHLAARRCVERVARNTQVASEAGIRR